MYTKTLKKSRGSKKKLGEQGWEHGWEERAQDIEKLTDLYCLADKFIMEELQNAVMDEIMSWHMLNISHPAALRKLARSGHGDSKLHDYLVNQISFNMLIDMLTYRETKFKAEENRQSTYDRVWGGFFNAGSQDAYSIIKKLVDPVTAENDPAKGKERCAYHTHTTSEACAKDAQG